MRLGLQAGPYRPHVHQLTLLGSAAPQRRTYSRTTWVGPCCATSSWTSASASGVIVPTPTSTLAYPSSDKCASSRMGGELLTGCRMPNHDLTLRIIRASMSDICRYSTLGMTVFQGLVGVKKVFLRGARAGDPNWESRDPGMLGYACTAARLLARIHHLFSSATPSYQTVCVPRAPRALPRTPPAKAPMLSFPDRDTGPLSQLSALNSGKCAFKHVGKRAMG